MPSHKIASRQAELARKKRKHHEAHTAAEALQSNVSAQSEAGTAMAAPANVPDEVRARPSLMSSYKAVSTQPSPTRATVTRNVPTAQAEYFSTDIRRLMVTIGICSVILVVLTFVLR